MGNCLRSRVWCSDSFTHVHFLRTGACIFLLFFAFVVPPLADAGDHLDRSWAEAGCEVLLGHRQLGADIIFTMGPLSPFYSVPFSERLYWFVYAGNCLVAAVCAVSGWIVLRSFRNVAIQLAVAVCLIGAALILGRYDALLAGSAAVTASSLVYPEQSKRLAVYAAGGAVLGFLALLKFNLFVLSAAVLAVVLVSSVLGRMLRESLVLLVGFVMTFTIAWCLCGQKLSGIGTYVRESLEISQGYEGAMMLWNFHSATAAIGLQILLLCGLVVCLMQGQMWRLTRGFWTVFLVVLGTTLVSFRHATVRADAFHLSGMFVFNFVLGALLLDRVLATDQTRKRPVLLLCFVVTCISIPPAVSLIWRGDSGHTFPAKLLVDRWRYLTDPSAYLRMRVQQRGQAQARYRLAEVSRIVGGASVDLLSYSQGVLFLNELKWHPRPVFQGYSAYTAALSEKNRKYLTSDTAPAFLLLRVETIDTRYPASDDAASLAQILAGYDFVLKESDYLLFRRKADTRAAVKRLLNRQEVQLNRWVEVPAIGPDFGIGLGLRVDQSILGRLAGLCFRTVPVHIDFKMVGGSVVRFRAIPSMYDGWVLVNPFIRNTQDFEDFFHTKKGTKVSQIRLCTAADFAYEEKIQVEFYSVR